MRAIALLLGALAAGVTSGCSQPPPTTTADLVLHGATVIDGDGATHGVADVVVGGELISDVTSTCQHPPGAEVIDLAGLYILPGFVDMHAHLVEHGRDEDGSIPPRIDWPLVRRSLRLLVQHGVLTVRDPGSETEVAVTLRRMLEKGSIVGPRLRTAGRILNASQFDQEPFQPVGTAEDVRREIQWQHAAGVDFIKIYSSMPPDLAQVAIEEAHALRLPVIGHLQRTPWAEAARMSIDQIAHGASWEPGLLTEDVRSGYQQDMFGRVYWLENLDFESEEVLRMLDALVRHDVVVDPTLIAYHTKFFGNDPRWLENADNALVPAHLVAGWRAGHFTRDWTPEQYVAAQDAWPEMLALTRKMFEHGVRLVVGTDSPTAWIVPGASFHDEMTLLRDAGIPEPDVLRMATSEGARALGLDQEIGFVQPGYRADIVVLNSNPLERIENTRSILMVVQAGRVVEDGRGVGPLGARTPR